MARISFDHEAVAHFCKKQHIHKFALFGSVLRDDFGPDSDVDVLVEFEPGAKVGLFDISGMELELSPLFGGRKVDLRTLQDLGRHMRDRVIASAEGVYAA
ncbi:MAG: nucleotidyltransferase domain-containing protein [SAR324 cluster bacterium]|nr:nucleotidyltransferase domain-containing protein [SAR324 cluster bacterium]